MSNICPNTRREIMLTVKHSSESLPRELSRNKLTYSYTKLHMELLSGVLILLKINFKFGKMFE